MPTDTAAARGGARPDCAARKSCSAPIPARPGIRSWSSGATPRLRRVLDAFAVSPAIGKTATWDVVGRNRAAAALLTDYAEPPRDGATSCG